MILGAPDYCVQVTEDISLEPWRANTKASFSYNLDDGQQPDGPVFLPLMSLKRGQALLEVDCKHADKTVPLLSKQENVVLTAAILFSAAEELLEGAEILEAESDRREVAKRFASLPLQTSDSARRLLHKLELEPHSLFPDIPEAAHACATLLKHSDFNRLANILVDYYYLTAVLDIAAVGTRPVLELHYTVPFLERCETPGAMTWRARLRALLGTSANALSFPLSLADYSDSYHLRLSGPPGSFVREQSVRRLETVVANGADVGVGRSLPPVSVDSIERIQGRPSSPTRNVHIHLEKARARVPASQDLYARVLLYERPPGEQGRAALLATISGLLLGFFGANLEFFVTSEPSPGIISGVPALLFAIPGLAAVHAYPAWSPSDVGQIPIRARLALAFAAWSSFCAAISIAFLSARSYGTLSLFTHLFWYTLAVGNVFMVIVNLLGISFNQRCLGQAVRMAEEACDDLTEDDVELLKRRDRQVRSFWARLLNVARRHE